MNKEEYLHQLEQCLKKHMAKSDIEDILRDYGEYFEDGRRQSKSDTEISARLGSPDVIAQQIIEENKSDKAKKVKEDINDFKEKAFNGFNAAKEKITSYEGKTFSSVKQAGGGFLHSLWNILKFLLLLFVTCICAFVLGSIFLGILGIALGMIGTGIAGLVTTAVVSVFISPYLTLGGVLLSIALISLSCLIGIAIFVATRGIFRLVARLLQKEEVEINA